MRPEPRRFHVGEQCTRGLARDALSWTHARRMCLIAALVLLPGCTELGASGSSNADTLPTLTLEKELRIGSAEDPDAGFSSISSYNGMDVDRDGNMYVLDVQSLEIRVFSHDGDPLRTFSRRGEGPGELEFQAQIGVLGDTVWALENFIPRIHLFTRAGEVLSTSPVIKDIAVPLGDSESTAIVRPQLMGSDGALIAAYMGIAGTQPADAFRTPRVRIDASGQVLDTIGFDLITPPPPYEEAGSLDIGGREYTIPQAPRYQPYFGVLVDGRLLVDGLPPTAAGTATFTVARLDLNGDTVTSRAFEYEARRYTDAYLDTVAWRRVRAPGGFVAIVNGVARLPSLPENADGVAHAIRDALSFPEFQAPIESAKIGEDGSIWLNWSDDGSAERAYIVLRPDLEPLGQLVLPRTTSLGWLTVDTVWLIERDEFDVPWLVRYRVRAAP